MGLYFFAHSGFGRKYGLRWTHALPSKLTNRAASEAIRRPVEIGLKVKSKRAILIACKPTLAP
jgi:hypothetical protein